MRIGIKSYIYRVVQLKHHSIFFNGMHEENHIIKFTLIN